MLSWRNPDDINNLAAQQASEEVRVRIKEKMTFQQLTDYYVHRETRKLRRAFKRWVKRSNITPDIHVGFWRRPAWFLEHRDRSIEKVIVGCHDPNFVAFDVYLASNGMTYRGMYFGIASDDQITKVIVSLVAKTGKLWNPDR